MTDIHKSQRFTITTLDRKNEILLIRMKIRPKNTKHKDQRLIITDSVVLWKIQKFDWLIPKTK